MRCTTLIPLLIIVHLSFGCQGALDVDDETLSGGAGLSTADDETADDDSTKDDQPNTDLPNDTPDMGGEADVGSMEDMGGEPDMPEVDPGPQAGEVVEFRIPAGSGEGPWNGPDTAVVIYVGQILRVVNDDSIDHQIHAPDDGAIDHGGRMSANGGTETFEVMRADPLDPARTSYYDHELGRPANFWIDARDLP